MSKFVEISTIDLYHLRAFKIQCLKLFTVNCNFVGLSFEMIHVYNGVIDDICNYVSNISHLAKYHCHWWGYSPLHLKLCILKVSTCISSNWWAPRLVDHMLPRAHLASSTANLEFEAFESTKIHILKFIQIQEWVYCNIPVGFALFQNDLEMHFTFEPKYDKRGLLT